MGKWQIDLDLDELWPPASELVGLQFDSEEEFQRCQAVLARHLLDLDFRSVNKWDRFVVVRKTDLHLFHQAGLRFTERQLVEPKADRTPAERAAWRATLARYLDLWTRELGGTTRPGTA
ncbi:MAG TPA: hypothetical protein VNM50_10150 [Chloroflexota bacterium]|nr:hypothetical protein [Chloroflexota bacterium]